MWTPPARFYIFHPSYPLRSPCFCPLSELAQCPTWHQCRPKATTEHVLQKLLKTLFSWHASKSPLTRIQEDIENGCVLGPLSRERSGVCVYIQHRLSIIFCRQEGLVPQQRLFTLDLFFPLPQFNMKAQNREELHDEPNAPVCTCRPCDAVLLSFNGIYKEEIMLFVNRKKKAAVLHCHWLHFCTAASQQRRLFYRRVV